MKHTALLMGAALSLAIPAIHAAPSALYELKLKVVDEAGQPVPAAMVATRHRFSNMWSSEIKETNAGGTIVIPASPIARNGQEPDRLIVWVAAPGRAFERLEIEKPNGTIEKTVTLKPGREVAVTVSAPEGGTLGEEASVILYTTETAFDAWGSNFVPSTWNNIERPFNLAAAPRAAGNTFTISVPESADDLCLLVNAPGVSRGFDAGALDKKDIAKGALEVKLPKPASLTATFSVAKPEDAEQDMCILLERRVDDAKFRVSGMVAQTEGRARTLTLKADDLPPGKYLVSVKPTLIKDRYNSMQAQMYRDEKEVTLSSGDAKSVEFTYKSFDKAQYLGDYAAKVQIRRLNGEPADNLDYAVVVRDRMFGEQKLFEGKTDEKGVASLTGLKRGAPTSSYSVEVRGQSIGRLNLTKGEPKESELVFTLAPMEGDPAPDLNLTDMNSKEKVKLSDFRGKVVFIDFWATWCGPCQEPMAHNSEILAKRGKDWEGKAVILPISCDDELEKVRKHVEQKGWTNLQHFWAEEGGKGFEAAAMRTYAIEGIPTAFLLDQSGKIVWRGHPSGFDMEKQIDALIAAK